MIEHELENACLVWLAGSGMSLRALREMLERFSSAVEIRNMFLENSETIGKINDLRSNVFTYLHDNAKEDCLLQFAEQLEKNHIRVVTLKDMAYPSLLKEISDAPPILFYRGNIRCLSERTIAMVGSRNASYKGMEAAEKIAAELADRGVTIVSGLADGIDTASHNGALKVKGKTAAILGCGLDRCYPATNQKLRDEILQNDGVVISEYIPGEKPLGWHFPVRNRIISGLSKAVIMIECKIKSGSMTTVRHALDQSRDVYAYPGEPGTSWSEGSHMLLREGAAYFTKASDILEDYHWLDNRKESVQNSVCLNQTVPLTGDQQTIMNLLARGSMSYEQLAIASGLNASALSTSLTTLQILGQIRSLPGKTYSIL